MSNETLHCSFCGKSQHEVEKLIAGPAVNICSECVSLCAGICTDAGVVGFKPPAGQALRKWAIEQAAPFAGGDHARLLEVAADLEAHVSRSEGVGAFPVAPRSGEGT